MSDTTDQERSAELATNEVPPAGFLRPFRLCPHHVYIYDAHGRMAADFGYDGRLRARGWGRIQYLPNPEGLMAVWAAWLFANADGSRDPEEVLHRLNVLHADSLAGVSRV